MADIKVVRILTEVPKHDGVATSLRVVEVAGKQYLDIRDIISTPGEVVQGRGYLFPLGGDRSDSLVEIAKALRELAFGSPS